MANSKQIASYGLAMLAFVAACVGGMMGSRGARDLFGDTTSMVAPICYALAGFWALLALIKAIEGVGEAAELQRRKEEALRILHSQD